MDKSIERRVINSYEDLESAKIGEFLIIQNRKELKFDPKHLDGFGNLRKSYFEDRIYTISENKKYVFENQYGKNSGLNPVVRKGFLIKARIIHGTDLMNILLHAKHIPYHALNKICLTNKK